MDTSEDSYTEEALKDFDFLSSLEEMDTSSEFRGTGDGTDWGESHIITNRTRSAELGMNTYEYILDTTDTEPTLFIVAFVMIS